MDRLDPKDLIQRKRKSSKSESRKDDEEEEIFQTAIDCTDAMFKSPRKQFAISYEIVDSSSNGTYVNKKRLERSKPYALKNGDLIGVVVQSQDQDYNMIFGYKFIIPSI